MTTKRISTIAISSLALLLSACGGGGSGSGTISPINIGGGGGGGLSFTPNQFDPSVNFKDRCEIPRSGTNDVSGSLLHEKYWLRSWSNETYLWYDEITDVDPADPLYPSPIDYFDILKTEATTPSGAARDRFHFTFDTEEFQELVNSGASAGYGARFLLQDTTAPDRYAIVGYVEPGSPAESAGLRRGMEIIAVDGAIVADGDANVLNGGLFPDQGTTHTFTVREIGTTGEQDITVTADILSFNPVHLTRIRTLTNGERAGYMVFNSFGSSRSEEDLFNAMSFFSNQNVDHMVLDLRYNGGGLLDISAELGFMLGGTANTNGRTYEELVFSDKHPTVNPVTNEVITPTPFYSTAQGFSINDGIPLPSLNLDTVYILTSDRSCSASESLINALRGVNINVVQIGTTTCGKPYGFYPTDNCGTTYFTIQFTGVNDMDFGDFPDGFSPSEGGTTTGVPVDGCIVEDDFFNQLGDNAEGLFSAAMTHIETGACPTNTSTKANSDFNQAQIDTFEYGDLFEDPNIRMRALIDNGLILNERN